mgnify:CR=1 FL=1
MADNPFEQDQTIDWLQQPQYADPFSGTVTDLGVPENFKAGAAPTDQYSAPPLPDVPAQGELNKLRQPWTSTLLPGTPTQQELNKLYQPPLGAPATVAPPALAPSAAPVFTGNYRSYFEQLFPGQTLTQEMLKSKEKELLAAGMRLHTSRSGNTAWVDVPGIGLVDVIQDTGGLNRRAWQEPGRNQPSVGGGFSGAGSFFDEPTTRMFQEYLQRQMGSLEEQRTRQQQANVGLAARQAQAQEATNRLVAFLTQRAGQLQQPAYTGPEQEILRTQALDPIEADRQAAQQQALYNISARGLTPESGISQALANEIDAGYNRTRAGAQNRLAYQQINERRGREQEAQQLLASIPNIQRQAVGGDLDLMQMLDAALNTPRQQGAQYARQIQQLPGEAIRDAGFALGQGPTTGEAYNQAANLYGAQQQQGGQAGSEMAQIIQFLTSALGGR